MKIERRPTFIMYPIYARLLIGSGSQSHPMLQLSKLRLRKAKSLTPGHTKEPGFEVRSLQFQNPKAYLGPGLSLSVLNAPVAAAISNGGAHQ